MTDKDSLAQLNDHFARFLQHADTLLEEWKTYGDKLRASMDGEVRGLHDKVSVAVERAGKTAAANLDGQVGAALGDGLARLRGEVDQLTKLTSSATASIRAGGGGAKTSPSRSTIVLGALVLANLMLAVLIGMGARSCARDDSNSGRAGAAMAPPDAGTQVVSAPTVDAAAAPVADAAPPAPEFCTALAADYELAAATLFVEAAAATCGPTADDVKENLTYNLPAKAKKKQPKPKPKPKKGAK